MIILDSPNKVLQLQVMGPSPSVWFSSSWLNYSGITSTPGNTENQCTGLVAITAVPPPSTGQTIVNSLIVYNEATDVRVVILRIHDTTGATKDVILETVVVVPNASVDIISLIESGGIIPQPFGLLSPNTMPITTNSTNTINLTSSDLGKWLHTTYAAGSSGPQINLPLASTCPAGTKFGILNSASPVADTICQAMVNIAGSDTIRGTRPPSRTVMILVPGNYLILESDGVNKWYVRDCCFTTEWTNMSPNSVNAVTTPPSNGTVVINTTKWRRQANDLQLEFAYAQSSAGTLGSGFYQWSIPIAGWSVDLSVLNAQSTVAVGMWGGLFGQGIYNGQLVGVQFVSPYLRLAITNGSNVSTYVGSVYGGGYNTTTLGYQFQAHLPISNW